MLVKWRKWRKSQSICENQETEKEGRGIDVGLKKKKEYVEYDVLNKEVGVEGPLEFIKGEK